MGKLTVVERFMSNVRIDENGHWVWTAARSLRGYGRFWLDGSQLAHRVAYELFVGPIPKGLTIDHACHSRDLTCPGGDTCPHRLHVNPFLCLEPVTQAENLMRTASRRHSHKTYCRHGHLYSEENTYITPKGWRMCRMCMRINGQRARDRRKVSPK